MSDWIQVVLLGIIEGITEFLPVSSTGHLLIAEHWLARQSDTFLVVIQGGAVAAVLLIFKDRLRQILFRWREPAARDYLFKLAGAFLITAAGGLVLKKLDFELPESATPVGIATLAGGILFIIVERWLRGRTAIRDITWSIAIAVGLSQLVAAVFPGTSRSGAAILVALVMGLDRQLAIEFSFLLGVPTLLAAGGLKLVDALQAGAPLDAPTLALGIVVSAVTAFASVKWLLGWIRTHTFEGFGWYRIVLGVLVLLFL